MQNHLVRLSCCRILPAALLLSALTPLMAAPTSSVAKPAPANASAAAPATKSASTVAAPATPVVKTVPRRAGAVDVRFSDPIRWRSQMTCDGLKCR